MGEIIGRAKPVAFLTQFQRFLREGTIRQRPAPFSKSPDALRKTAFVSGMTGAPRLLSDLLIQGFRRVRSDAPDAQHGMEKTLNDTNRREQRLPGVDGGGPAIRIDRARPVVVSHPLRFVLKLAAGLS